MKDLSDFRKTIDEIDEEIMKLFEKRMDTVLKVAEFKKQSSIPVFNKEREVLVIEKNLNRLKNKKLEPFAENFLHSMMDISKDYQIKVLNEKDESKTSKEADRMKIFGLLGEKLSHSLSPIIHNEVFKALDISGVYNLFCVEKNNISEVINSLKVLGVKGVNVTIPYKEEIIKYLDEVSDEAKKIGAVNTVLIKDNKTIGYNTDYYGFGKMLDRQDVIVENNVFYVLGSGGAAKGAIQYLIDNKAKDVYIVSRDKKCCAKKFSGFNVRCIDYEDLKGIESSYGVINTTPCGMYPNINSMAITETDMKKFKVAIDIVYNPLQTVFLKTAKDLGLKTVEGLSMLVWQGLKAEEIWNNVELNDELGNNIYAKLEKNF